MRTTVHSAWRCPPCFFGLRAIALFAGWFGGDPSVRVRAPVANLRDTEWTSPPRSTPGFSLVELVVSMVIVAVLVGLGLAVAARSRDGGRSAASLAALRGHAQVLSQYTGDYRDAYPYFGDPASGRMTFPVAEGRMDAEFFHAFSFWAFALAEQYYGGDVWHPSCYSPEVPVDLRHNRRVGVTSYHLPCVFVARPEYWRPTSRIVGHPPQLGATRASEVLRPARKALLVNAARLEGQFVSVARRGPVFLADLAFCDASAQTVRTSDLTDGMAEGDGIGWPGAVHSIDGVSPFHTLDGVRGEDLRP